METFEEQAIATSPYKPRIWKRYVVDTFTVLDRGSVDRFLQQLNNQQPSIRFTMETESDTKLVFFDTAVSREPDGRLTTSVYRKPTHTDQYLAYDSHHPQSVKRGIVNPLLFPKRKSICHLQAVLARTWTWTARFRGKCTDREGPRLHLALCRVFLLTLNFE